MQAFLRQRIKTMFEAQSVGKIKMTGWELGFIIDMERRYSYRNITPEQKEKINKLWDKYERDAL